MPIYKGVISLPGASINGDSALPVIRDIGDHKKIEASEEVVKKYPRLGCYTNYRVLPYTMQNRYDRVDKTISIKTIVYENRYLKATFLSECGGRLYSLFHKKYERELLNVNPVFQPANLGIRNAWFSGGIEWNIGQYGHSCLTCEPVFFGVCINEKKEEFLRLYEYERMKKLFYQIDFYLPENLDILATYTRIINPYDTDTSLYYWTNIAVDQRDNARVFSEEKNVIYVKPYMHDDGKMINTFECGVLPNLEGLTGDMSYLENFSRSNEYFYQNKTSLKFPWESVGYDDGFVFYEYSSQPLRYRKMFCWGTHRGGEKWQQYLSRGTGEKYFEIQAGLFPTQLHAGTMQANSQVQFMQVFGALFVDDVNALYGTLECSTQYIKNSIFRKHQDNDITSIERALQSQSKQTVHTVLSYGQGWGHLECERMKAQGKTFPIKTMHFPAESVDHTQHFWKKLLAHHTQRTSLSLQDIPKLDLDTDVLSYMIDLQWQQYLEHAIKNDDHNKEWYSFHCSILYYENGYIKDALEVLEHIVSEKSAPIVLRTIGAIYNKLDKKTIALSYYEKAYRKIHKTTQCGVKEDFLCEYFQLLYDTQNYTILWQYYERMLHNDETITEETQVIVAQCAFELQKWPELEKFFEMQLSRIREGNNVLCELWFKKKAHDTNNKNIHQVREQYKPPAHIDFRML